MSADNWGICPSCYNKALQSKNADRKTVEESYGKISLEDFNKMFKEAARKVEPEDFRTLREDYEIGVDREGTFEVTYSGHCSECGFIFRFNKTIDTSKENKS